MCKNVKASVQHRNVLIPSWNFSFLWPRIYSLELWFTSRWKRANFFSWNTCRKYSLKVERENEFSVMFAFFTLICSAVLDTGRSGHARSISTFSNESFSTVHIIFTYEQTEATAHDESGKINSREDIAI